MRKVEAAAAQYHPAAVRAAGLYFVLASLSGLSHMYAFGLPAYTELFAVSLARSARSERAEERVRHINSYHTYAVFRHACRCRSRCMEVQSSPINAVCFISYVWCQPVRTALLTAFVDGALLACLHVCAIQCNAHQLSVSRVLGS